MTCPFCEPADRDALVYADDVWRLAILPSLAVPGWVVVSTVEHRVGWTALNDAEVSTIGPVLREVSRHLVAVVESANVYQVVFGDNHPHFHTLLVPVTEDMTRGPSVLIEHPPFDQARADEVRIRLGRRLAASGFDGLGRAGVAR